MQRRKRSGRNRIQLTFYSYRIIHTICVLSRKDKTMCETKTFTCTRSRLHGFDVDWIVDAETDDLILVVPMGDRLDIAPYNEEFTLTFKDGKLDD